MLIAVPSDEPGGLAAPIADHFGHCAIFTIVKIEDGEISEVTTIDNQGHEEGGCMAPVMFLKKQNVDALIAGGMGMRPLTGFQQEGITVYFRGEATTVGDALQAYVAGKCEEFGQSQTCGGGGGECGGHHHHEVEREPIEGKADVQKDRVVSFDYKLTAKDGKELDSSEDSGPMCYLHGHSNIVPGLEKELEGLEAGAHKVVELAAADAYGERDESKIIEVARDQLPEQATVGAMVQGQLPNGQAVTLIIAEMSDDKVKLDGNHPLAGMDLTFDVTIVKVEAAIEEEIAHGHVH